MQVSVFGRTDKRPCIYTLIKMLQPLGDVAIVTANPMYKRLTEDGSNEGFYQNVAIFVTDATADELWSTIEHSPEDYEYIILDNLYNEETDVTLYIQGAGVEALDEDLFDVFDNMVVITMGKGKGKHVVPYTVDMLTNMEFVEFYRTPKAISPKMATVLADILSTYTKLSAKDLLKVVNKK